MDAWKASTLLELAKLYNGAWRALSRGRCWLCAAPGDDSGLCAACARDLPWRETLELDRPIAALEVCRAPLAYVFPVTRLVRAAKFRRDMAALGVLARLTAREVSTYIKDYDYLLPVPLAPGRFVSRGFNQATGIARELERASGLTVRLGVAIRPRGAPAQSSLPGAARAQNVRNAFTVRRPVRGDAVVIVDDVVTTGATLAALARSLRQAGARRVAAVTVAEATLIRYRDS